MKISLLFAFVGVCTLANAQTSDSTHTEEVIRLKEIVISANKWEQSKEDVPGKITTITSQDVALQNPQTVADLLGSSGEVFIQKSQQGGGSPMIRGFATNRLLYSIDGVRMNTAIFRAGNLQNVISLDAFSIENTEVLFGPGSVAYGSDAIGGVMSFQTLTPTLSDSKDILVKGKAVSRFASANNEGTNHLDVNVGWKKWASLSSITYSNFGDLTMGTKGPEEYLKPFYVQRVDNTDQVFANKNPLVQDPTGYKQLNMMQKLRFKPNENWDFQYGFHYSETSEYSRYDRMMETDGNGVPLSAVWNYGPQKWMMNHLSVKHTGNNKLYDEMNIRLAQQYFEESRIDRRFNHHRLRTQLEQVNALSANIDFAKKQEKHHWFYGLEAVRNKVESTGSAVNINTGADMLVPSRYPESVWSTFSAYLNHQYHISEKFILQGGLRYSRYQVHSDFTDLHSFYPFDFTKTKVNNGALTGSIGAVYKPADSWLISINGSTGFRAPNVDDMGKMFDFQAGTVIVPNGQLKAEYAYNAELSLTKTFGELLKLDVTGFYTYLNNAMVRRPFAVNGQDSIIYNGVMSKTFAIQNAARAEVYGFHAGFELKLPEGFGVSSRFNYQLGTEEMDDKSISRSRHAAPWFGVSRVFFQKDKVNMQFYAMYSGEVAYSNLNVEEQQKAVLYAKDKNGDPYSPAWMTLNFKVLYSINNHFSVSGGLENITDQRYRPYSSGLTAPGRNFILSARVEF